LKKILFAICLAVLVLCQDGNAFAAHEFLEKEYQDSWCKERGGIQEYRLDDGARVDCLLPEYAVEFDFGPKWAECIGQAIFYGKQTNRTPACVLILESEADMVFVERLRITATKAGVKWWTMTRGDLIP
jgi:hypothetical protein